MKKSPVKKKAKGSEKTAGKAKPRVIVRLCDEYDPPRIQEIIRESMDELGMKPRGKVFIKPNVVSANKNYIHNSFTEPSVVESAIKVLKGQGVPDITVGESGGFGIPSRLFLKEAGYLEMGARLGVRVIDLNEHPVDRVELKKGKWHKSMLLARDIKDADFKIWMPKLKFHIFAQVTHALKLNIGILQHAERMLFHDHRIHEKIVDLLEVGYPDLVITDAIDITYGYESAPYPVHLGALIIANDPVAADTVTAHIMGYRPEEVQHLKIASQRGYGSISLKDISVEGDADIDKLRAKPKGQTRLFQHLNELDTPIQFYTGHAPDTSVLCDGGCEGAVKGCLGTIEKRRPGSLKKAKKGAIVQGIYKGDVIMPDGPVLLLGDCTRVEGKLDAKKIYRVKGCPIGVKVLFMKIPFLFGLPNPMFDTRDSVLFVYNSVVKGMSIALNRYVLRR
ncbi:MAG: DUF362 domain-containing protein [Spirochaetes bacterium]|nr:MAG: DUF362 domain-containing protein [Spirochaetota bacterium]